MKHLAWLPTLFLAASVSGTLTDGTAGTKPTPQRSCGPAVQGIELNPSRVGWSELELKATKFLLSTTSVLELGSAPTADVELQPTGDHRAVKPSGDEIATLRIASRYLGRETFTTLWFDPLTGRGLQGERFDPGERRKVYRFADGGMLTRRWYPADASEERSPPDGWTRVSKQFYPFVPEPSGTPLITDPGVVLWLLGAAPLDKKGDSLTIAVFSEEHLLPVRISVEDQRTETVRYLRVEGDRETEVADRREALKIALRPAPGADEDTRRRFQLLGLEGDIDVLVDRRDRLPLLIEGSVKVVGHIKVRLKRAVLGERPHAEANPQDAVNAGSARTSNTGTPAVARRALLEGGAE